MARTLVGLLLLVGGQVSAAETARPDLKSLEAALTRDIQPLLVRHCHKCHAADRTEADIDLAAFVKLDDVRRRPKVWQKVAEMLDSGQMPPKGAPQPSAEERTRLQRWVRDVLTIEAAARAGDPGPVVLRRLNNAEYTYTLRDLTGVESLDPAREFPVDSASGEGFTNVGNSLVMSPALLAKYLDAAKQVAAHAVLLPDGLRFSPHTTRRDWTNDALARVRAFYGEHTSSGGGMPVDLQGIKFDTNEGGRLPVEAYLAALISERNLLADGKKSIERVARERRLSAKYLDGLRRALLDDAAEVQSPLLTPLKAKARHARPDDVAALAKSIAEWQNVLWKFNAIGHIGRAGGPKSWMEPVSPLADRQEFRVKLPAPSEDQEIVLYLTADDAGDGAEGDFVVWERPRFVAPGRPDLLLRDVRRVTRELPRQRARHIAQAARCLGAAAEAGADSKPVDVAALARKHGVDSDSLGAWLDYLGIGTAGPVQLGTPIGRKLESASGYDFIKGWVGDDALSVLANSSDQRVRIPGTMKPHSVAVHPAPKLSAAVGWRSPAAAKLRISAVVQRAHPECGNGFVWSLELRRGSTRQKLAGGVSPRDAEVPIGPLENVDALAGDVVSLIIDPRDGNHSCDLTAIDLTVQDGTREWNLARDVAPDILAGNPHADRFGNAETWHFYSEPPGGAAGHVIPADSTLAKWQSAGADEKPRLAEALQRVLQEGVAALPKDAPDAALYRQLTSFSGPFMTAALRASEAVTSPQADAADSRYGLDPARFGRHPDGSAIDAASLCVQAPAALEVRLPAELVAGAEFVAAGTLHAETGNEGSVQLQALTARPDGASLRPGTAVVTRSGSAARRRFEAAFDQFRNLFPPALCYTKIVPVDEAVTLTLYYREDDHLRRLMLDDEQAARLDRLWDELLFIAREPLELVTAFEQISEFATQDRPDLVEAFKPLRQPILDRAAKFRQRLVDCQPKQVEALLDFAERAYRRPLSAGESGQLEALYAGLRRDEIPHEEAVRLTLARVLIAPAFLYRAEKPGAGAQATPVSDWELASRLSYFLWSSLPDRELRQAAASGRLRDPQTLVAQTRRMLRDPRTRRLATEFACQWLHVYGFDQLQEKSERHFPTFAGLRGAMYEESILFFADLFQNDRPLTGILDADYTFLNEDLAKHYGIPGVTGPEWRRVDGVRQYARGGILAQGATLAKQSGASRTSPILRGNWLSEVVLGEKLPRPPKDVPQLADAAPEGLTERQLIEQHSSDPACAKCHARIDPFGFALENFDAIGRFRQRDAGGLAIDSKTTLPDGTPIEGLTGLRDHLLTARREAFLRQFNRKLLGYALGRAVQLSDEPLLDEMRSALQNNEGRVGSIVETIVLSRQFREIRGREAKDED